MRDLKHISLTVVRGNIAIMHDIDRDNFLDLMFSLKRNYTKNNQISSRFIEAIPDTESVLIYEDRNVELDVPFVVLKMFDGEYKTLYIPRSHKIIWGILTEFVK